jgi:hypothetical protein
MARYHFDLGIDWSGNLDERNQRALELTFIQIQTPQGSVRREIIRLSTTDNIEFFVFDITPSGRVTESVESLNVSFSPTSPFDSAVQFGQSPYLGLVQSTAYNLRSLPAFNVGGSISPTFPGTYEMSVTVVANNLDGAQGTFYVDPQMIVEPSGGGPHPDP